MMCFTDYDYENNKTRDYKEYNKIQNLFLEDKNIEKLVRSIYRFPKNSFIHVDEEIIFEGMFNWGVILEDLKWAECDCDEETLSSETGECICELNKQFSKKYGLTNDGYNALDFSNVYCNIQPLLGEDYTYILRKMKRQIELTDNYKKNEKDVIEKNCKYSCIYPKNIYVLIIKEFKSTTTTIEQLLTIFGMSKIKIVFTKNIQYISADEVGILNTTHESFLNKKWGKT